MTTPTFDMNAALQALREGKDLTGKDGILTPLIKQLTEAAMQAELDEYLVHDSEPNRKNGSTRKTMKSAVGSFELNTPWESRPLFLGAVQAASSLRSSKSTRPNSPMNWSARCSRYSPSATATRIFALTWRIFMA